MRRAATRVLCAALTALAAASAMTARGADVKTPYEAEIVADDVPVRAGNGSRYYVTGKLRRGDRVRVHRHDPGGWYMIAPPQGSFSWIRADYVQRQANVGVLTQNQVVVRVGTEFGDDHEIEQVRLSTGDQVEILGERILQLGPGATRMYQIKPPQGEYRWIEGKHVIPADPVARQRHDRDPFRVPSTAQRAATATTVVQPPKSQLAEAPSDKLGDWRTQTPVEMGPVLERPVVRTDNEAVRRNAPPPEAVDADRVALEEIDNRFRDMIKRDPREWDLDAIQRDYDALKRKAERPALLSQLEMRSPAIERYRRVKTEYDDLIRLTSETSRRDAELATMQQRQQATMKPASSPSGPLAPKPEPEQPTPAAPAGPQLGRPEPVAPQPTPEVPKLDGAGIVQRSPVAYGPIRHVLVAPDGRILAFLQARPGVSLDQVVGQEMGVFGQRTKRADLRSDFIVVQRMMPVRLAR